MKDVIIKIYKDSSVYTEIGIIGINYENLQGKLVFEFVDEFVDGTAYLEFERKFEKGLIPMNKVGKTYEIEIKSSLLKEIGNIELQLRITQDSIPSGIPVYKSKVFTLEVLDAINATSEIPDEYPEWIDLANEKIKEMDNLNITTERVEDGVDIVLTDKKGNTTRTEVKDGAPGPAGPQGAPGAVKMQVVDTLPETGETDTIYLVKKDNPGEQNLYDEYVYTDTGWEHIGDTSVDLSDYYTKEESDEKIFDSLPILYTSVANGETTTKESDIKSASEVVNTLYKNGKKMFVYHNYYYNVPDVILSFPQKILKGNSRYDAYGCYNETGYAYIAVIRGFCVYINGTWDNEVFTCTSVQSIRSNDTIKAVNVASTITDTTTNPVQGKVVKKYVDDNIKTYTAGNNITISDDNMINCTINENTLYIGPINMNIMINLNDYKDSLTTLINNNLDKAIYIVIKGYNNEILFGTYSFSTPVTTASSYTEFLCTFFDSRSNRESFSAKKIRISYERSVDTKLYTVTDFKTITDIHIPFSRDVLTRDNTGVYTPTGDYNPATKKYVDDAVATKQDILTYSMYLSGPNVTDTEKLQVASDLINNLYKSGSNNSFILHNLYSDIFTSDSYDSNMLMNGAYPITNTKGTFKFMSINNSTTNDREPCIRGHILYIYGTWTDDVFTANRMSLIRSTYDLSLSNLNSSFLNRNNTTSYTPTADYNPSTKLYTDKTHYENMTGYDATKTQVLKNINGTLTWVNE